MKINNLQLKQLVDELAPLLKDAHINKIQELPNNWLKLKIHTKEGTKDLVISENIFYLTKYLISPNHTANN